ncbi:MAG TPA: KGG domain-containing protein [Thermoanaerobaculia bacterium]|nr:KGG domain-containing protein [Thermoanaerobaculia bacterium]
MASTSKRGFASMDPGKQKEIASKGGRAAHAKGTAHEFTSDEARVAGRKGGEAVSRDRAHMSAIGREGGHSRGRTRQASSQGLGGSSMGSADFERGNYIGHASDRESAGAGSNLGRNEQRGSEQLNRNESGSFSNRGQF